MSGSSFIPTPTARVGRIEVKARDGAPLGMLTQGASGFTVRRHGMVAAASACACNQRCVPW